MNSEILELAKECGFAEWHGTDDVEFLKVIDAFYKAAYNRGVQDACKSISNSDDQLMADFHVDRLRKLEMK